MTSSLELLLGWQITDAGLPPAQREFPFATSIGRRWRFDFAWAEPYFIAVECMGGTWSGGRHVRGKGYENDCEKTINAILLGWIVIPVTGSMVEDGRAIQYLKAIYELKKGSKV